MRKHYLQILGLPETATKDDIRKAYRQLAKKYHPDISKEQDAHKKFIAITEAYDYLTGQGAKSSAQPKNPHTTPKTKPQAKPKTKEEIRDDEREKIREMFRKQQEESRRRAEQYAKMSFREFRKTDYFRNTFRDLLRLMLSPATLLVLFCYYGLTTILIREGIYLIGIPMALIPPAFVYWVLTSRPEKGD